MTFFAVGHRERFSREDRVLQQRAGQDAHRERLASERTGQHAHRHRGHFAEHVRKDCCERENKNENLHIRPSLLLRRRGGDQEDCRPVHPLHSECIFPGGHHQRVCDSGKILKMKF